MWFGVFVVFFWAYRAWKASFSFSSSSACASTPLCCHSVQPGSSLQYPNEKKLVGKSWMESYINLQSSHGIAQWRGSGGVLKNKTSPRKLIYWVVSSYVNTVCMYKLKVHCFHMSLVWYWMVHPMECLLLSLRLNFTSGSQHVSIETESSSATSSSG